MKLVCKDFNTKLLDRILEYHKNKPNEPIQNKYESDIDPIVIDNISNDSESVTDVTDKDSDTEISNNIHNNNPNNDESNINDSNTNDNVSNDCKSVADYSTDEDCDVDMIKNDHNHNCNDDESDIDDLSIGNHPNIHNNNLLFSDDSVGDADDEMEDEDVPQTLTDAMYKSYLIKTFNQKK
eukprot:510916_1